MKCEHLSVDIIEQPINVLIGQDTFNANLSADILNIKILEETIKTYHLDEVFQSTINGFCGSSDPSVIANYFVFNEIPAGLKNNINKIYTLANTPVAGASVVYLNGLLQAPNFDYTMIGNTITFVKALRPTYDLYVSYMRII